MSIKEWLTVEIEFFLNKKNNLFLIQRKEEKTIVKYLYQYPVVEEITGYFIEMLGEPIILIKSVEKKKKKQIDTNPIYNWQLSLDKQGNDVSFYTSQIQTRQRDGFLSRLECIRDVKKFILSRIDIIESLKQYN